MSSPPELDLGWEAQADPDALLKPYLGERMTWGRLQRGDLDTVLKRRLRQFGAACVRMVWDLLGTEERSAIQISERFAQRLATLDDLRASAVRIAAAQLSAHDHARAAAGWASAAHYGPTSGILVHYWDAAAAARGVATALALVHTGDAPRRSRGDRHDPFSSAREAARAIQADILRDIFPPPGAVNAIEPNWRTSAVVELAHMMDATGNFTTLSILADALEEAGCTNSVVLNQCRKDGPHLRGNWVVELLLDKQ